MKCETMEVIDKSIKIRKTLNLELSLVQSHWRISMTSLPEQLSNMPQRNTEMERGRFL